MHLTSKYRQYTAALLLMVYVFIAAPVQLWHNHDAGKQIADAGTKTLGIYKIANTTSEANCPVCHHQYSVYNDDSFNIIIEPAHKYLTHRGYYLQRPVSPFSLCFANKGPPYFA